MRGIAPALALVALGVAALVAAPPAAAQASAPCGSPLSPCRDTSSPASGGAGTVLTVTSQGGDPCPLSAVGQPVVVTVRLVELESDAASQVAPVGADGNWTVHITVPGPPAVYEQSISVVAACSYAATSAAKGAQPSVGYVGHNFVYTGPFAKSSTSPTTVASSPGSGQTGSPAGAGGSRELPRTGSPREPVTLGSLMLCLGLAGGLVARHTRLSR